MKRATVLALVAVLAGCHREDWLPTFTTGRLLGGRTVSAEVLNVGRDAYVEYCRACHGDHGDGRGPSAEGMRPPPRDFTRATFKFASTLPRDDAPTLPRDEDLVRVVRSGLHGTAMLGWEVPPAQLDAIVQYLKTFSPRWEAELPGEQLVPSADPYAATPAEGVELGRKLYHSVAQCSSCHPSYATSDEVAAFGRELNPAAPVEQRKDARLPVPTDSMAYSVDRVHPLRLMPPDFLSRPLRSVDPSHPVGDLYRVIALGIDGAAMPAWKDSLPEPQLWALAHYVASLTALRDTPEAEVLRERLELDDARGRVLDAGLPSGQPRP